MLVNLRQNHLDTSKLGGLSPIMLPRDFGEEEDLQNLGLFEDWDRDLKKANRKFKKDLDKTGRWINTKAVKWYNDLLDGAEDNQVKRLRKHRIDRMGQIQGATAVANYMADKDRARAVIDGANEAAKIAVIAS